MRVIQTHYIPFNYISVSLNRLFSFCCGVGGGRCQCVSSDPTWPKLVRDSQYFFPWQIECCRTNSSVDSFYKKVRFMCWDIHMHTLFVCKLMRPDCNGWYNPAAFSKAGNGDRFYCGFFLEKYLHLYIKRIDRSRYPPRRPFYQNVRSTHRDKLKLWFLFIGAWNDWQSIIRERESGELWHQLWGQMKRGCPKWRLNLYIDCATVRF